MSREGGRIRPGRFVPASARAYPALLLCFVLFALTGIGDAEAVPGNAWFALTPAPEAGDLQADSYLADPAGWPSRAAEHDRGWAVAYRAQHPPAGWTRPFVIRGGGAACRDGILRGHFAGALQEMLPERASAILTLLDPPDSAACSPGKPCPHPFLRDGWLGLHDGYIGIRDITEQIWWADLGTDWESFKLAHPRDYHGRGLADKGNASEIYFLTFLYEVSKDPSDVPAALERTVYRMWGLHEHGLYQLNLLVQSSGGTWVARYAIASPEEYPVYYGRTTAGEYWISDEVPPGAASWQEMPNFSLACFPPDGPVELRALVPVAVREDPLPSGPGESGPPAAPLWLRPASIPSTAPVVLEYFLPGSPRSSPAGLLEIFDISGRRVFSQRLPGGRGSLTWTENISSGIYLARLRPAGRDASGSTAPGPAPERGPRGSDGRAPSEARARILVLR